MRSCHHQSAFTNQSAPTAPTEGFQSVSGNEMVVNGGQNFDKFQTFKKNTEILETINSMMSSLQSQLQ
jgi:hypothetical protein